MDAPGTSGWGTGDALWALGDAVLAMAKWRVVPGLEGQGKT